MKELRYLAAAAAVSAPALLGAINVGATSFTATTVGSYENSTLTLTSDSADCLEVESGQELTLNLGGHTLTNSANTCATIWVKAGGKLTITGDGTVTNVAGSLPGTISNYGELTIEGGSFTQNADANRPVIDNFGKLSISAGNFSGMNTTTGRYTPVINSDGGSATATISGVTVVQNGKYNAVQTVNGAHTTIEGGSYSTAEDATNNSGAIGNYDSSVTTITNGIFTAASDKWVYVDTATDTTSSIEGGVFTGKIYADNNKIITGGDFYSDPSALVADGYEATWDDTSSLWTVAAASNSNPSNPSTPGTPAKATSASLPKSSYTVKVDESINIPVTVSPDGAEVWAQPIFIDETTGEEVDTSVASAVIDNGILTIHGEKLGVLGFHLTSDYSTSLFDFTVTVTDGTNTPTDNPTDNPADKPTNDSGSTGSKDESLGSADDTSHLSQEGYAAHLEFKTPISGATNVAIKEKSIPATAVATEPDLKAVFDISVKDGDGKIVSVKDNKVKISITLDINLVGNYKYFQITYLNADGQIVEWIDPDEVVFSGNYVIVTFTTSHLSDYGVLASNTKFVSAATKNKAYATGNTVAANSSDTASTLGAADTGFLNRRSESADGATASSPLGAIITASFAAVTLIGLALRSKLSGRKA